MEKPLVSVIVATYNSQDTILDTLESIKEQTYENIELIVTDDMSKDDTVQCVRNWMKTNRRFFSGVRLIRSRKNTGVTKNCNRGIYSSHGIYIKTVGGDDRLLPNCIADSVDFLMKNDYEIVLSRYKYRGNKKAIQSLEKNIKRYYRLLINNEQELLREKLVVSFSLPTTTSVFTRRLFDAMGGYDCRLPFWEDIPFYYKLIDEKIDIGFFDKETYEYNIHDSSISHAFTGNQELSYAGYMHLKDHISIFYLYELGLLLKYKKYDEIKERAKKVRAIKMRLLKHKMKKYLG